MNNEEAAPITLPTNYSGACEYVPLSNEDLLKLTDPNGGMCNGSTFFALKYRVVPCTMIEDSERASFDYNDISAAILPRRLSNVRGGQQSNGKKQQSGMFHSTSVINFLTNEYKVDPNTFFYKSSYNIHDKKIQMFSIYIDLGNYLSVQLFNGIQSPTHIDNPNDLKADQEDGIFQCFCSVKILHVPQTEERAQTLLQQLSKFKLFPVVEATLQMVCNDARYGFYTSPIHMKKPHITDLKLHYGDEFADIHEELLETLQEKDSTGITFLHGPPGTGKTSYLRYLINEINEKKLIYVPPDMVNDMTKPGFLPFLMKHPNSILIVEDAENIVRDRQQDSFLPNQAVANLLNLSDGLLGDAMHQQIICTFNCDVKGVDPALLREGRLVIEHKFDKLSVENARRMCTELGIPGNGEDIQEPITLAEIYARKDAATNGLDNSQKTTKSKRSLKKKTDTHLGFYS